GVGVVCGVGGAGRPGGVGGVGGVGGAGRPGGVGGVGGVGGPGGAGNKWQHNPAHRGGAPYGDRNTANKFGGTARGDSLNSRQRSAQRDVGRQGGNLGRTPRPGGVGDRGGTGNRSSADFTRGGSGNRGAGGDRVGNRSVGSSSSM